MMSPNGVSGFENANNRRSGLFGYLQQRSFGLGRPLGSHAELQMLMHMREWKNLTYEGSQFDLRFSRDGSALATACGECLHHLKEAHSEIVTAVEWMGRPSATSGSSLDLQSPLLVTGSLDRALKLWKGSTEMDDGSEGHEWIGGLPSTPQPPLQQARPRKKSLRLLHTFTHGDWVRCIAAAHDNSALLSGCVASGLALWDVNTGAVLARHVIKPQDNDNAESTLNTINSLHWRPADNHVYASGSRDGYVHIFDRRAPTETHTFQAHVGKLNTVTFSTDDRHLMTAGRDGTIRLWDVRQLPFTAEPPSCSRLMTIAIPHEHGTTAADTNFLSMSTSSVSSTKPHESLESPPSNGALSSSWSTETSLSAARSPALSSAFASSNTAMSPLLKPSPVALPQPRCVQTYSGHQCGAYNVRVCFANNERWIVSGSEDGRVYFFDYYTGEVVQRLRHRFPVGNDPQMPYSRNWQVVHLVDFCPKGDMMVAAASIGTDHISLWRPAMGEKPLEEREDQEQQQERYNSLEERRMVVEDIMSRFGDRILTIFHRYNFTFSSQTPWHELLSEVAATDSDASELLTAVERSLSELGIMDDHSSGSSSEDEMYVPDHDELYAQVYEARGASRMRGMRTTTERRNDTNDSNVWTRHHRMFVGRDRPQNGGSVSSLSSPAASSRASVAAATSATQAADARQERQLRATADNEMVIADSKAEEEHT